MNYKDSTLKMSKNQTAALAYASAGLAVFPCKPDKAPYWEKETLENGKDDATTNSDLIRRWWQRWPDALIGCYCERSGFWALDIDRKDGRDGFRSWTELVTEHGDGLDVKAGPIQETPSGGFHVLFSLPEGAKIPNNSDQLADGLDLRSNGYIILASPESGYRWVEGHGLDQPLTAAPEWLIKLVIRKPSKKKSDNSNGNRPAGDPGDAAAYWLKYYLERAAPGSRNQAGFELACQLRDSGLSESEAESILLDYQAKAPGGAHPYTESEALASLRSAYAGERREAATLPGIKSGSPPRPVDLRAAPGDPDQDQANPENDSRSWSVADLLDTDFPEPRWAIPGIIPEGLTLFGGRPKTGKSWFMLLVAWAVGTGGQLFDRDVERGSVLYIALEDSPRRLQERAKAMGIPRDADITFHTEWRPLQAGGLEDLILELERKEYRLVVIDTLTRAIPGVDQAKDQGTVSMVFNTLQKMALRRRLAAALIDHTRKPLGFAADPVDDILHTTGKTAVADAILALYKEQGKAGATLLGRGRDFEDVELALEWDVETRCWQVKGRAMPATFDEILIALETLGRAQVGDIARETGQNRGNVYKRLVNLVDDGLVIRSTEGRRVFYEFPPA